MQVSSPSTADGLSSPTPALFPWVMSGWGRAGGVQGFVERGIKVLGQAVPQECFNPLENVEVTSGWMAEPGRSAGG